MFFYFTFANSLKRNYNKNDTISVYLDNLAAKDYKKQNFGISKINYFSSIPRKLTFSFPYFVCGQMKIRAPFDFHFKIDEKNKLCHENVLNNDDINNFNFLILNDYSYVFSIDNLQKKASIGEVMSGNQAYIYSSFDFTIQTNQNSIIDIDISMSNPVELKSGQKLSFHYSSKFIDTSIKYKNRRDRYKERFLFESQLHDYSSALNSIQCLLYVLLVTTICKKMLSDIDAQEQRLRTARDFDEFDLLTGSNENKGWRSLHADVFRTPKNHRILTYLISFGFSSMTFMCVYSLILYILNGENNESIAFSVSFLVSIFMCGFMAASYHSSFQEKETTDLNLISIVFPIMGLEVVIIITNILFRRNSVQLLPLHLSIIMYLVIDLIVERLSFIGEKVSYKKKIYKITPSQVAIVQKMNPKLKWYYSQPFLCVLSSFLISSCILPEFYFIQTSLWIGKEYYTYMYLCIAIFSTFVCSAFLSISITYFRLQKECHKWQWLSFLAPSSCSIVLFIYSFFFYFSNLTGSGISQFLLYIIWSFVFSLAIGLGCGGSGYFATNLFIRLMYSNLKLD